MIMHRNQDPQDLPHFKKHFSSANWSIVYPRKKKLILISSISDDKKSALNLCDDKTCLFGCKFPSPSMHLCIPSFDGIRLSNQQGDSPSTIPQLAMSHSSVCTQQIFIALSFYRSVCWLSTVSQSKPALTARYPKHACV